MITIEKPKSKVITSIQSLEESVDKYKNIFHAYLEENKEIPANLFDPYYTMNDRLETLYEMQRQERIKEALTSKINYKTRAIS